MRSREKSASVRFHLAGMTAALALLPVGLRAQETVPAPTPASPGTEAATRTSAAGSAAEVAALAEQITVLRALKPLGATPAQLGSV